MAIYRAAQWILVNNTSFTCVTVFSDSQAAIKSLSGFLNNSRIVRECRRCLNLLSGFFTSISLVSVNGHCNILGICRVDELASADALLPESSSIKLGMALASLKLTIARKLSPSRWPTSFPLIVFGNFTRGVTTGSYACSSDLCDIRDIYHSDLT